jgi:hypothetical protein
MRDTYRRDEAPAGLFADEGIRRTAAIETRGMTTPTKKGMR